ncbi:DUF3237 family protein [Pseudomonas sp. LABIM340]|uniref:DUF3237 family protein n=1 Tax=Pseudomonas sp. LABIM340 TaxID=3156585 RepID=UPI0032AEB8B9
MGSAHSRTSRQAADLYRKAVLCGTRPSKAGIIDSGGIWRLNESGLAKKAKGLELRDMKESDFYCRTSPRFRTQPGAHAWLNDYVFVGTIDGVSEHEVLISVYKVGGA